MAAPGLRVCSPFFKGWSCGAEYAFTRFAKNCSFPYDFAQRDTKRMSSRSFADYLEMKLLRDKISACARQIQHPDASICSMRFQKMAAASWSGHIQAKALRKLTVQTYKPTSCWYLEGSSFSARFMTLTRLPCFANTAALGKWLACQTANSSTISGSKRPTPRSMSRS